MSPRGGLWARSTCVMHEEGICPPVGTLGGDLSLRIIKDLQITRVVSGTK
jgi:hypothetical protein